MGDPASTRCKRTLRTTVTIEFSPIFFGRSSSGFPFFVFGGRSFSGVGPNAKRHRFRGMAQVSLVKVRLFQSCFSGCF
jgi:hypothetical protein